VSTTPDSARLLLDQLHDERCRRPGEGLFITALDRELKRRRLTVPAFEHDLAPELRGKPQAVLATGIARTLGTSPRTSARAR
jgi:hypothetical protein